MNLTISRIYQSDCTVGMLNYGDFRCFTLELPWLDNAKNISCIPKGLYPCKKHFSQKFGMCLDIQNVTGRSLIRMHKGNYTSQIEGCILPGDSLRDINGDGIPDVTSSSNTLNSLLDILPDEFLLEIN